MESTPYDTVRAELARGIIRRENIVPLLDQFAGLRAVVEAQEARIAQLEIQQLRWLEMPPDDVRVFDAPDIVPAGEEKTDVQQ